MTKPSRMRGESGGLSRRSGRLLHAACLPRGPAPPCPRAPGPPEAHPAPRLLLGGLTPGSGVRGGAPAAGSPAHLPFTLGGRWRLAAGPGPAAARPAPRPALAPPCGGPGGCGGGAQTRRPAPRREKRPKEEGRARAGGRTGERLRGAATSGGSRRPRGGSGRGRGGSGAARRGRAWDPSARLSPQSANFAGVPGAHLLGAEGGKSAGI